MAEFVVELARRSDVDSVPEIEARAATLLSPEDLPPEVAAETTSLADYLRAEQEGRLLVAKVGGGRVVGFALMILLEGASHLEELDVDPDFGRRGIGRALVAAAIEWAQARGDRGITLSTFAHVAWNAPFYATIGFEVVAPSDYTPAFERLREHERAIGLDVAKRVIMRRLLEA